MHTKEPVIRTAWIYPPIPMRRFDWTAWIDGHEEGAVGFGATEEEAIADLKLKIQKCEE